MRFSGISPRRNEDHKENLGKLWVLCDFVVGRHREWLKYGNNENSIHKNRLIGQFVFVAILIVQGTGRTDLAFQGVSALCLALLVKPLKHTHPICI